VTLPSRDTDPIEIYGFKLTAGVVAPSKSPTWFVLSKIDV